MAIVACKVCGTEFNVVPARLATAKFCSYKCAGINRTTAYKGDGNHRWKGGERKKTCQHCGMEFEWNGEPYSTWLRRKFCSKHCADAGGFRYSGESHPNWNADSRRKNRGGNHHKWVNAVLSRDNGTCRNCGATGIELHAHHVKSYRDHPDLRFDVNNGLTLCYRCHWAVHAAQNEKAVNSVKPLPSSGVMEGNTEPSLNRKVLEGVTTRGRAYRRVEGMCSWCGAYICRRFSDVKPSRKMFCNKHCAGKYMAANRSYRRWKNPDMAVISSTSPAPEREEIV